MVNFCNEKNFRSGHRIVFGQEQFQLEQATFERGVFRPGDFDVKIPCVAVVRLGADAGHRFCMRRWVSLSSLLGNTDMFIAFEPTIVLQTTNNLQGKKKSDLTEIYTRRLVPYQVSEVVRVCGFTVILSTRDSCVMCVICVSVFGS